jgi:hypothetical protein
MSNSAVSLHAISLSKKWKWKRSGWILNKSFLAAIMAIRSVPGPLPIDVTVTVPVPETFVFLVRFVGFC